MSSKVGFTKGGGAKSNGEAAGGETAHAHTEIKRKWSQSTEEEELGRKV